MTIILKKMICNRDINWFLFCVFFFTWILKYFIKLCTVIHFFLRYKPRCWWEIILQKYMFQTEKTLRGFLFFVFLMTDNTTVLWGLVWNLVCLFVLCCLVCGRRDLHNQRPSLWLSHFIIKKQKWRPIWNYFSYLL